MTTAVVGMFSGEQWTVDHAFCQAGVSPLYASTDISITPTNSTPMQSTCFPMDYTFHRHLESRQHETEQQRGFTWVEVPPNHHLYTNRDPVAGSSRMSFGSVILRPNLPSTAVFDDEDSDMAILRVVLQHQTLDDECVTTTVAEHVTLAHPFTMTSTVAERMTLPHPSPVTLTTTMTRTLTQITARARRTAPTFVTTHNRPSKKPRRSRTGLTTPRRTGRTCRNAPRSYRWALRQFEGAMAMDVDEVDVMRMQCDIREEDENHARGYYTD